MFAAELAWRVVPTPVTSFRRQRGTPAVSNLFIFDCVVGCQPTRVSESTCVLADILSQLVYMLSCMQARVERIS